jgi:hypothetical protein
MPSEDEAAIMSIFQYARNIRGLASIKLPKVIYPKVGINSPQLLYLVPHVAYLKVIKQTNGDDCGIYTIHFGRLWIMDGKKLWHMILVRRSRYLALIYFTHCFTEWLGC